MSSTSRAIPIRSFSARAPAARARRLWAAPRFTRQPKRSLPKPSSSRPRFSPSTRGKSCSPRGFFPSPGTNRTLTIPEIAKRSLDPKSLPDGMEPGLIATAVYEAKVENFPNGCHVCEVEIDEETGTVVILRYSVVDDVGTVLNPLLLEGQICGGVAQGIGQVLAREHRLRSQIRAASDRLVHGLRHAACRRSERHRFSKAIRCRRRPIRWASKARARRAASARCRRSPMPSSMRSRFSASGISRCRQPPNACGGR